MSDLGQDQSGKKLKKEKMGLGKVCKHGELEIFFYMECAQWPLLEALRLCSHGLPIMHLKAKGIKP